MRATVLSNVLLRNLSRSEQRTKLYRAIVRVLAVGALCVLAITFVGMAALYG